MILLIVPSRSRPQAAAEFADVWRAATDGRSRVVFCLDDDDPTGPDYRSALLEVPGVFTVTGARKSMCGWTNAVAAGHWVGNDRLSGGGTFDVYGSLGDDHRLEPGFESHVYHGFHDLLAGPGIVAGDDGIHGADLPSAPFVSADIVDALGYMIPAGVEHLYADNFWVTLGREADCFAYVPELRTPHLHPLLTTADVSKWDPLYQENNSDEAYARDGAAFDRWMAERMTDDVAKVRALRTAAAH